MDQKFSLIRDCQFTVTLTLTLTLTLTFTLKLALSLSILLLPSAFPLPEHHQICQSPLSASSTNIAGDGTIVEEL